MTDVSARVRGERREFLARHYGGVVEHLLEMEGPDTVGWLVDPDDGFGREVLAEVESAAPGGLRSMRLGGDAKAVFMMGSRGGAIAVLEASRLADVADWLRTPIQAGHHHLVVIAGGGSAYAVVWRGGYVEERDEP